MRSSECRKQWNNLVDLAEGRDLPETAAHAAGCADCGRRLEELRSMMRLTAMGAHSAPADTIRQAQSIFVPRRQVLIAGLSAVGAGARSVAEAMQIRREVDGVSIRLMIRPEGAEWRILGQITGSTASEILCGDQIISIQGGVFEFTTDSLDEDLWLEDDERLIRVPLNSQE